MTSLLRGTVISEFSKEAHRKSPSALLTIIHAGQVGEVFSGPSAWYVAEGRSSQRPLREMLSHTKQCALRLSNLFYLPGHMLLLGGISLS